VFDRRRFAGVFPSVSLCPIDMGVTAGRAQAWLSGAVRRRAGVEFSAVIARRKQYNPES